MGPSKLVGTPTSLSTSSALPLRPCPHTCTLYNPAILSVFRSLGTRLLSPPGLRSAWGTLPPLHMCTSPLTLPSQPRWFVLQESSLNSLVGMGCPSHMPTCPVPPFYSTYTNWLFVHSAFCLGEYLQTHSFDLHADDLTFLYPQPSSMLSTERHLAVLQLGFFLLQVITNST